MIAEKCFRCGQMIGGYLFHYEEGPTPGGHLKVHDRCPVIPSTPVVAIAAHSFESAEGLSISVERSIASDSGHVLLRLQGRYPASEAFIQASSLRKMLDSWLGHWAQQQLPEATESDPEPTQREPDWPPGPQPPLAALPGQLRPDKISCGLCEQCRGGPTHKHRGDPSACLCLHCGQGPHVCRR